MYLIVGILLIFFFVIFYKSEYSILVIIFKIFTLLYFGYFISWIVTEFYDSFAVTLIFIIHYGILLVMVLVK